VAAWAKVGMAQREGSGERGVGWGLWFFVVAVGGSGDVRGGVGSERGVFRCASVFGCGMLVSGVILGVGDGGGCGWTLEVAGHAHAGGDA